jgi:lysophospholipase L1-like esterase
MIRKNIVILLILIFSTALIKGQQFCDTLPFLNCERNEIIVPENDSNFDLLVQKFRSLKSTKDQSLQIVHIGDSHLQAGFLTEKIKQNLFQYFSNDSFAAPGFIFPYTMAKTNNPYFFKVDYSGKWTYCKNVDQEKTCKLGLSGITLQTTDSISTICIKMRNNKYNIPTSYYFNQIKILHNNPNNTDVFVNENLAHYGKGYSIIKLEESTDSICITINQKDNLNFELYGIILENTQSQINYHTIGVNGATAQSYLKCDYFSEHLQLINPDLIILSLGTNEAYDENFSKIEHKYIFKDLILQIKDILPNTNIICISANDHINEMEYSNPNVILVNDNIRKTCKDLNLAFWDFYSIMGGENSITQWYSKGLTGNDKLHFRRAGYEIQGELFTEALINLIERD